MFILLFAFPEGSLAASPPAGSGSGCTDQASQPSHRQHSCLHLEVWPAGVGLYFSQLASSFLGLVWVF